MNELILENWELAQVKAFEAVKEVNDIVEEVEEVADKKEEAFDKVDELDIELKFELKIAKQDEGHPHKALGPLASFFYQLFKDEIILNQILAKNNLTSIGTAGKPKVIWLREDEERILYVKKNSELAQENKDRAEEIDESVCRSLRGS